MKQLWILAGGNGSGKSTFYDRYLKKMSLSFVNADNLAKEISDDLNQDVSKTAQEQAMAACTQKIEAGETFCFETVFSHESKVELIKKAKAMQYEVNLVFIHLEKPTLNVARVFQRVESGGHDVPYEKIKKRIPKALENLKLVIPIVDNAALVDNSSTQDPLKIVVKIKNSIVVSKSAQTPTWAVDILNQLGLVEK